MRGENPERVQTHGVPQHVDVVQHQQDRLLDFEKSSPKKRSHLREHLSSCRLEDRRINRPDSVQSLSQVREKHRRVVVALIQCEPQRWAVVGVRPLSQEGWSSLTGRSHDGHDLAVSGGLELLDEARTSDDPWSHERDGEFCLYERERRRRASRRPPRQRD
jgi:hypothetical protein